MLLTIPELVQQFQTVYWQRYPDRATMAGVHAGDACLPSFHSTEIGKWLDLLTNWESALKQFKDSDRLTAWLTAVMRFHLDWERLWYEALGYPYRDPGYAHVRLAWSWLWPLLVEYQPLTQRLEAVSTRLQAASWYLNESAEGHAPDYPAERPPAQLLVDFALEDIERLLADVGGFIECAFHRDGELHPRDAECLAMAYSALVMQKNSWLPARSTASTFSELRWGTDRMQHAVNLLSGSSGGLHDHTMRLNYLLYLVDEELQLVQTELRQLAKQIDRKQSPSAVIHALESVTIAPDEIPDTVRNVAEKVIQVLSGLGFCPFENVPVCVVNAPRFFNHPQAVSVLLPGPFETPGTPITLAVSAPNPQWPRRILRSYHAEFGPQRLFITLLRHFAAFLMQRNAPAEWTVGLEVPTWKAGLGHDLAQILVEEYLGQDDLPFRIVSRIHRRTELVRFKSAVSIHIGRMKMEAVVMSAQEDAELEPEEALQEAQSAIRDPIGCMAPTLGRWQWERLRERCRTVWGNAYSHQRFYWEISRYGPSPIPLLEPLLVGPA